MSANVDFLAPKHNSSIRVVRGKTTDTAPSAAGSYVPKDYVDAAVSASSGSFSLTWNAKTPVTTTVKYVTFGPYAVILAMEEFAFTGAGAALEATNNFPAAILPTGSASTPSYNYLPITVEATALLLDGGSILKVPRATTTAIIITPLSTPFTYTDGTVYRAQRHSMSYTLVEEA